jgi:hypothetical protein
MKLDLNLGLLGANNTPCFYFTLPTKLGMTSPQKIICHKNHLTNLTDIFYFPGSAGL